MQAPRAPGGRFLLPLAAAALLLLLVLLPAGGEALSRPKPVWSHLVPEARSGARLDVSSPVVQRTTRTALNYYNYRQGSPSSHLEPTYTKKASVKIIPGVGRKYFVLFATKHAKTQDQGTCVGSVFYLKSKPKPHVEISCSSREDSDQRRQQDYDLYLKLKGNKEIPLVYLWGLGTLGSSFIAWEKSSEDQAYALAQIRNAQLRNRGDDAPVKGDFDVVLNDDSEEPPISCYMSVTWMPGQDVQVEYKCSSENSSSESADGSGEELGSTEYYSYSENNF